MSANPIRGETSLQLGSEEIVLRPTFDAISKIEAVLGIGGVEILERFTRGRIGVRELAVILTEFAQASGATVTLKAMGEKVVEFSYRECVGPAIQALKAAIDPRKEDEEPDEGNS